MCRYPHRDATLAQRMIVVVIEERQHDMLIGLFGAERDRA